MKNVLLINAAITALALIAAFAIDASLQLGSLHGTAARLSFSYAMAVQFLVNAVLAVAFWKREKDPRAYLYSMLIPLAAIVLLLVN